MGRSFDDFKRSLPKEEQEAMQKRYQELKAQHDKAVVKAQELKENCNGDYDSLICKLMSEANSKPKADKYFAQIIVGVLEKEVPLNATTKKLADEFFEEYCE